MVPGTRTLAEYRVLPVTFSTPSTRGTRVPMTVDMRYSVQPGPSRLCILLRTNDKGTSRNEFLRGMAGRQQEGAGPGGARAGAGQGQGPEMDRDAAGLPHRDADRRAGR